MGLAPSTVALPSGRFDSYRLLNKGNMISGMIVLKNPKLWTNYKIIFAFILTHTEVHSKAVLLFVTDCFEII